ncbi:MAG: DUF5702 domain-containing protein [bacterium]|nr:DUF5702 domain-containing protein [bacterium]
MTPLNPKATVYREEKKCASAGSVTIFAALSLLLVASFLLTLLEVSRVRGLFSYAAMNRMNAMESVFSEYERTIFENYGVFLLDGGYGESSIDFSKIHTRLQKTSEENMRPDGENTLFRSSMNFYRMKVAECQVVEYVLATDEDGSPFRMNAVAGMKKMLPAVSLSEFSGIGERAKETMTQAQGQQSLIDAACEEIENAERNQHHTSEEESQSLPVPTEMEEVENPIDTIKDFRRKDILSFVLPAGTSVSTKQIRISETLEQRSVQNGINEWKPEADLLDDYFYHKYLQTYFSSYMSPKPGLTVGDERNHHPRALDYELEYIVSGKDSDRKNLKAVVSELLLLREGINYAYLQTDAAKQNEARAIATAILSATGMVAMVEVVTQGILAAWAFAESVLELRTLFSGGRIAWSKTAADWNSNIKCLGSLLSGNARAKEQPQGEDYDGYLEKLLYLKTKKQLNFRAMDLIEQTMRRKTGSEKLRMDAMIVSLKAHFCYEATPLFSKMVTIRDLSRADWRLEQDESYSYLP